MPYVAFYQYLPGIAQMETRVITLLSTTNEFQLPVGEYAFLELFCDECDCRRVFFNVLKEGVKEPVATISWGWESKRFYRKWFGSNDKNAIDEMMGCRLPMVNRQSSIAPKVLEMFIKILFNNDAYTSRVKKYYDLFRDALKKNIDIFLLPVL